MQLHLVSCTWTGLQGYIPSYVQLRKVHSDQHIAAAGVGGSFGSFFS